MFFHSLERWRSAVESTAVQVLGPGAERWLAQPNPDLSGRTPRSLLDDRAGAKMVMELLRGSVRPPPRSI